MFFFALRLSDEEEEEETAESAAPRPLTRLIIFLAAETEAILDKRNKLTGQRDLLIDCLILWWLMLNVLRVAVLL